MLAKKRNYLIEIKLTIGLDIPNLGVLQLYCPLLTEIKDFGSKFYGTYTNLKYS